MYKKTSYLVLSFFGLIFFGFFLIASVKKTTTIKPISKGNELIQKEDHTKNISKFKYAVFDISGCFWEKELYELLYSYQKRKGIPLFYYFKLIKYGVSYAMGSLNPKIAYEDFLNYCKGESLEKFKKNCALTWEKDSKDFILKDAVKTFEECKKNKVVTILAESGMKEIYSELLKKYSFDHVCASGVEFKDGVVSGKLLGEPCTGKEKYERVKNLIEKKLGGSLKDAVFYANSHQDIQLLEAVGKPIAVNPTSKLLAHAKKKGWEVLQFKELLK